MQDNSRKYGFERDRTNKLYNLHIMSGLTHINDFWEMPIIKRDDFIPGDLMSFNYCLNRKPDKNTAIHFFIDDYQFSRVWNAPERYVEAFKKFGGILTPDFSCYTDMLTPQIIYNIYRSRLIGAYYQTQNIKVIPTISWSFSDSFRYAFKGIEKGSTVAISTVGIMRNKFSKMLFDNGVKEMINQIEPENIILYGSDRVDTDFRGVNVINYKNKNSIWEG